MAKPGTINASNFFGEDKVEQYRQELVADGKIPGTKENATPEERREGLKLYRKNKIEFKTFVENVLKKKSAASGGFDGGGLRPTRSLLPGTKTNALVKYKPPIEKEDLKAPKTEVPTQQVEQGFDDILDKIDDLLKEIRDTNKFEKAVADKDRKEKEKDKREQKESRLEGLKKIIEGPAQKILAPIKNIFQEIMDAIGKILFAKVGVKLIEWYSNPENAEKLNNVIKFFRRHWLLIIGGLLLFGTRLNGIVMFLLKLGFKYVPKLLKLTFDLFKAAGRLALRMGGGALKALGKAGPLARAALVSPAAKIIAVGAGIGGAAVLANEVTGQRKAAPVQAENAVRARRGKGLGVQGTDTGIDKTPSPGSMGPTPTTGMLQTARGGGLINSGNRTAGPLVTFNPTFAFSSGGAPLGTDTIPAMLSPGEFVMSKGAVQQFGVDTFTAMNAAGGGTNRPKLLSGTLYAQGGGYAGGNTSKASKPKSSTDGEVDSLKGIKQRQGEGGLPAVTSVGKQLLGKGFTVGEHKNFRKNSWSREGPNTGTGYNPAGGERVGGHSSGSLHYKNLAIDVTDWRPGDWKGRTKALAEYMYRQRNALKLTQIIHDPWGSWFAGGGKGGAIGGHDTHLHLGFASGPGAENIDTMGDYNDPSSGSIASSSGGQVEQITNPMEYLRDTFKLYQEVFGTTPSDVQKVTPTLGVPSPQQPAAPNPGVSNDIPKLGSIDPNNRSIIGMKAMHNIVG